jgi:hypothetical protein
MKSPEGRGNSGGTSRRESGINNFRSLFLKKVPITFNLHPVISGRVTNKLNPGIGKYHHHLR